MQLTRTTVRFRSPLKKAAEMKAVELDITFQALLERALELYLNQESYKKARKHKTQKDYIIEFEKDLKNNLLLLRSELLLHCYRPKPLVNFIIHDPKTRKISKSDFRDRIAAHSHDRL